MAGTVRRGGVATEVESDGIPSREAYRLLSRYTIVSCATPLEANKTIIAVPSEVQGAPFIVDGSETAKGIEEV